MLLVLRVDGRVDDLALGVLDEPPLWRKCSNRRTRMPTWRHGIPRVPPASQGLAQLTNFAAMSTGSGGED
eukprot:1331085-Pyramimonas_sp.AAC.1